MTKGSILLARKRFLTVLYDGSKSAMAIIQQKSPSVRELTSVTSPPRLLLDHPKGQVTLAFASSKDRTLFLKRNDCSTSVVLSPQATIESVDNMSGVPMAQSRGAAYCFHRKMQAFGLHKVETAGGASVGDSISRATWSSQRTGCYTVRGVPIRYVASYAATGATVVNENGKPITFPIEFRQKVLNDAILRAAWTARVSNPDAAAFTYIAYLPGNKVYCGYTRNPQRRFRDHIEGIGAKVVQELPMQRVVLYPHATIADAELHETKLYIQQCKIRGASHVRGAHYNARFSFSATPNSKNLMLQPLLAIDAYELIL